MARDKGKIKEIRRYNKALFDRYREKGILLNLFFYMVLPGSVMIVWMFSLFFLQYNGFLGFQIMIVLASLWFFLMGLHFKRYNDYYATVKNIKGRKLGKKKAYERVNLCNFYALLTFGWFEILYLIFYV